MKLLTLTITLMGLTTTGGKIVNEPLKRPLIRLLVTIVNRGRLQKISELYENEHVHLHYICLGHGTATSEILDMLGLGSTDKAVIFSFEPYFQVKRVMNALLDKLELKKPGNGIAFTIPITGVSSPIMQLLESELINSIQKEVDSRMESIKSDIKNSLIVSVVNQGFTENVIAAAKQGGARGGTVVHARRSGSEKVESFFGISIDSEKEIVMILSPVENKAEIMKCIGQSCGMTTEARGLIFSLPVEDVAGINLENIE